MKTGRSQILICRSLWKRNFQKSTVEKVLNHLLNIKDFKAAEKRAEELIQIIEDERNTEADIIAMLERMEAGENKRYTMSITDVVDTLSSLVNGIRFEWNGNKCGVISQVKNYIVTYEAWCGDKVSEYKNIEDLISDRFFDGKSLTEICNQANIYII